MKVPTASQKPASGRSHLGPFRWEGGGGGVQGLARQVRHFNFFGLRLGRGEGGGGERGGGVRGGSLEGGLGASVGGGGGVLGLG